MSAGPVRQVCLMSNSTELGKCSSIFFFFFFFVCANLSHLRPRLGAAPRPWVSETGWSLSPTRGATSLERTQVGRALSSAPHPRVSSGAFQGNWRVWLHNCKLQINEQVFFIDWPSERKKNSTPKQPHYLNFMQLPKPPKHFCFIKDQNGVKANPHFCCEAV